MDPILLESGETATVREIQNGDGVATRESLMEWCNMQLRVKRGLARQTMESAAVAAADAIDLKGKPLKSDTKKWTKEERAAIDNKSLGLFAMGNPVRKFCLETALNKDFDRLVLFVIFLNCTTMGLETPFLSEDVWQQTTTTNTPPFACTSTAFLY